MNSEKVKEIKKALECCANVKEKCDNKKCQLFDKLEHPYCERQLKKYLLTLINELESENERLQEQNGVLIRDLDYINRKLTNVEIQIDDYIDRIAELEKEKKENTSYAKGYADGIKNTYEVVVPEKLKQFAERLLKGL